MGNYWLLIPLALAVGSLIFHQLPLLFIALLFFLAGAIARLWGRYCLHRVSYRRQLSAGRVFWGEDVTLEVEITNRKILPLFWLQVDDEVASDIIFQKGNIGPGSIPNRSFLNNVFSLSWYHKITRRYPLTCRQRGYFSFGPARITSGDLFGTTRKTMSMPDKDYLMVYPRVLPLETLGIPADQAFGDIRLRRHLFHDPILTAGVRDYSPGDSLKQVHWKTTARRGTVQTKLYEPTTTIDMAVFYDVRTTEPPFWGSVPGLLELGIVTAASISRYALDKGYRTGLYVNQNQWTGRETSIKLPPSQSRDQWLRIMEVLAKIDQIETMPIARLIAAEGKNLPWGSTMVVITAVVTDGLLAALLRMKKAGRRIVLVIIGDARPDAGLSGLNVQRVRESVSWDRLENLALEKTEGAAV